MNLLIKSIIAVIGVLGVIVAYISMFYLYLTVFRESDDVIITCYPETETIKTDDPNEMTSKMQKAFTNESG